MCVCIMYIRTHCGTCSLMASSLSNTAGFYVCMHVRIFITHSLFTWRRSSQTVYNPSQWWYITPHNAHVHSYMHPQEVMEKITLHTPESLFSHPAGGHRNNNDPHVCALILTYPFLPAGGHGRNNASHSACLSHDTQRHAAGCSVLQVTCIRPENHILSCSSAEWQGKTDTYMFLYLYAHAHRTTPRVHE